MSGKPKVHISAGLTSTVNPGEVLQAQAAERLEAALSEIRALPDEWETGGHHRLSSGGKTDVAKGKARCAAELRAILEKYDA